MVKQMDSNIQLMRWFKLLAAALGVVLLVSGCARESASSQVYRYGEAQREQVVRYGTVQSVRPITIQSERTSGVGAASGAARSEERRVGKECRCRGAQSQAKERE